MAKVCPHEECEEVVEHRHGTEVLYVSRGHLYGEDVEYSVDKPGTLDYLLFLTWNAGALAQETWRVRKGMGLEGHDPDLSRRKFEEWRRTL